MSDDQDIRSAAKESLQRIQNFDPESLVQATRLGEANFERVVQPARKLIDLFKQLPVSALDVFPNQPLSLIRDRANNINQLFEAVMKFDVDGGNVRDRQQQSIQKIVDQYQQCFTELLPLISYSIARTVDFNQLENQGRAAVQSIRDQTEKLMEEIEGQKEEASRILDEVRKTAAERGVSQEATYFKDEADKHKLDAESWRWWTIFMAVVLGVYGVATLFFHKLPWIAPSNVYETVQFTLSKVLIFFVLAYLLALCARNFLSNRHNEIVNRHRQNALMTYKSLVDAGGTPEARDVILNHAASSVYRLHDTGYSKSGEKSGSTSSAVVEMLPRTSFPLNPSSGS